MSEKTTDNKLPYTCTSAYDRNACKGCVCSTCYEQEFCDRCSSCENQSKRKERCNAYEGHTIINAFSSKIYGKQKAWV